MNNTVNKPEAARRLNDEITDMQLSLERAEIIMQDVDEDYFNTLSFNPKTEEGRFRIAHEFDRNRIKSDIVTDYLFRIRKQLEELNALCKDGASNG